MSISCCKCINEHYESQSCIYDVFTCISLIFWLVVTGTAIVLCFVVGWHLQVPKYTREGNPMATDFGLIFTTIDSITLCLVYGAVSTSPFYVVVFLIYYYMNDIRNTCNKYNGCCCCYDICHGEKPTYYMESITSIPNYGTLRDGDSDHWDIPTPE